MLYSIVCTSGRPLLAHGTSGRPLSKYLHYALAVVRCLHMVSAVVRCANSRIALHARAVVRCLHVVLAVVRWGLIFQCLRLCLSWHYIFFKKTNKFDMHGISHADATVEVI